MTPLVSVILPVYNAGPYVAPAIESILAQTHEALELIVVDDGSTDGCLESVSALSDPRVRLIRQTNRGKSAAMNVGLNAAAGAFYAIQDADDVSAPHRIETLLRCLVEHEHLAGVFSGYALLLEGRRQPVAPKTRLKNEEECARVMSKGDMPALDPTALYRLSMVGDIRYDEDLLVVQGVDYALRVGERFPLMVLPECLYYHRVHPASVTRSNPARVRSFKRLQVQRLLERRPDLTDVVKVRDTAEAGNELAHHFSASVTDQVMAGRRIGALRTAALGVWLRPGDGAHWRPLLNALAPRWLVVAWRRRRAGGQALAVVVAIGPVLAALPG